jgi:hypothetical protein
MDHQDLLKHVLGMCGESERRTEALLRDLAQEGLQGSFSASGFCATEATGPTHRPQRDDGVVGMFEVDFSGTLYEGINYVTGPGSTNKFGTVPPMARHGMVFAGLLDPQVPGYVLIIRESSGLYDGLYVPTSYEGRACVKRVADSTPLRPARPRTPPERGELSADVQGTWARYFAESGVSVEEVVAEAWAADGDASSTTSSSSCGSESSMLE